MPQATPRVTPVKRTSIVVRDLSRSLAFYRDALGMTVWMEGEAGEDLPAVYQLLGMPPCHTRWVILQSQGQDWGMVGLFELTAPSPADDTHPNIDRVNRGETCLVFYTRTVDQVHETALALGLTVLCPPTRVELPSQGLISKDMTLRDPNGVLLHFIQVIQQPPGMGKKKASKNKPKRSKAQKPRASGPAGAKRRG